MTQATLNDVITALRRLHPDTVISPAFGSPHSYRGYYDEVAFKPLDSSTAATMLSHAKLALEATFTGYKGGTYNYDLDTPVWIAGWGDCRVNGGDELTLEDIGKWGRKDAETLEKLDSQYATSIAALDPNDKEESHRCADDLLAAFLSELGFHKVVEAYNKVDKWYA